jgi:hypothetical protein
MISTTQIAKTAHAVHVTFCNEMIIATQPAWDEISEEHRQVIISSVDKIVMGEITSKVESHNNFVAMKKSQGWRYGQYNSDYKLNPRLVPFEELTLMDRIKESLFFETVKSFI